MKYLALTLNIMRKRWLFHVIQPTALEPDLHQIVRPTANAELLGSL